MLGSAQHKIATERLPQKSRTNSKEKCLKESVQQSSFIIIVGFFIALDYQRASVSY